MAVPSAKPSPKKRPDPGDGSTPAGRGLHDRAFLTYNGVVMAVAVAIVLTSRSEPAAMALGSIMLLMSAGLLLAHRMEWLACGTLRFLSRRMPMSSVLLVGALSLGVGLGTGLAVSGEPMGPFGSDAAAAAWSGEDGAFWEERMFHAMTIGDPALFRHACSSLAALHVPPGICAGPGAGPD